jgi:hypothetical protein
VNLCTKYETRFIVICHRLPGNVLWFEPPIVAGWDKDAGYWSTEDFHDLKFNEEKQVFLLLTLVFIIKCIPCL